MRPTSVARVAHSEVAAEHPAAILAPMADVLETDRLITHFQPILSARQRSIIGVEALARVALPSGDVLDADSLFRMATREALTAEVERRCWEKAIQTFARTPHRRDDQILFLNLGSWVTLSGDSPVARVEQLTRESGLSPKQVAIEILESRVDDLAWLTELVRSFRKAGFLLVLDDVGAGHSNLDRIAFLKPDILKVDRSLISEIDTDFHRQETLKSLVGLSRRIGALVVAEGVETEREAIVALELGADLLQGYFLGRPNGKSSVLQDLPADVTTGIQSLSQKFKAYMVRKINNRKLQHRRFNIVLNEVLCHLGDAQVDRFDEILLEAIGGYPQVECLYVLDGAGIQVTETIWNPRMVRRQAGVMFRPAPRGADHSLKEYYYIQLDVEQQKYTNHP
jgi:EAL domain-containing protein (putative c-di-GMP-specific phosphodiesterase class I)